MKFLTHCLIFIAAEEETNHKMLLREILMNRDLVELGRFLTGPLYQPGWARFCYRRKETLELHTIQFLSFTLSLPNITCFSHYHHNGEKTKKTSQIASWLLSLGWKWYISHFIGKASEIGTIRPYQCMKGENQEYLMNGTNMLYATPGPLVTQTHWAPGLVA